MSVGRWTQWQRFTYNIKYFYHLFSITQITFNPFDERTWKSIWLQRFNYDIMFQLLKLFGKKGFVVFIDSGFDWHVNFIDSGFDWQ